ncbi:MAG: tRNA pseudouridine(38-40) synthase TruA [Prolixibacteraceae bacterium]|nr:tRNA pseudouridine(38-40) synthase TruA [Burkholderiales bacterium]
MLQSGPPAEPALRIVLGVEYDGSAFCGWQTQPQSCGVQDALDRALAEVAGERIVSVCAGRTDAGVHALAQVVHFDTAAQRPLSAWTRGANALLPEAVAVNWARQVPDNFHARFSATGRRYVYWLLNRPQRPGLMHKRVGWFHQRLDIDDMRRAVDCLIGEHDFSAFRAAECQARTPVKVMRELQISRSGEMIRFDFAADAFLQHMVRNIVGSLVYIGGGRQPSEWLDQLLQSRDRTRAAPTFSPTGLYLAAVEYDPIWALPPQPGVEAIEHAMLAGV